MNKRKLFASTLCFVLLFALQVSAWGAAVPTVTQTFTLNPGWNAVYLEVQPEINSPAIVFKDLPKGSSVWAWSGKESPTQFIQDPSELQANNDKWLAIFASADESKLNNLYAVRANSPFLINLPATVPQQTLTISGRPTIRHKSWVPDSFNLTGFGFTSSPPTFAGFFAASNSHKNQAIYRLNNTSGAWEIVNTPATTTMRSGEAFWIYCQSGSDYQGALSVEADGADGLDFGAGITILTLTLNNLSTIDKNVSVSQLSSATPLVLAYQHLVEISPGKFEKRYSALAGMPVITVKAGSSKLITLVAKRESFTGSVASVLEFTDSTGSRIRVPVTATQISTASYPGLWSGAANLTMVSQLAESSQSAPFAAGTPKVTPAELNLNLILHQDSSGQVRLLKQAIVMQQDATMNADGSPRTRGRHVVLTKDSLISNYSGVSRRDGAKVGRRLSAIGFDYTPGSVTDPLSPYDSGFGTDFDGTAAKCSGSISSTVTCQLILESSSAYTHPTNPFLHKYHPDHDNLAGDFKTFRKEVNRIKRTVTLVFDSVPKDNPSNPPSGWGVSMLGGTYRESVEGLARGQIKTEGNFTIRLITDAAELNQ